MISRPNAKEGRTLDGVRPSFHVLAILVVSVIATPLRAGDESDSLRFTVIDDAFDFVHHKGATGKRYLVETMGSGLALLDYDGDGDLDVYLIDGAALTGDPLPDARNRLFRNRGDGTFEDATEGSGLGDTGYGMGCAVGDIDSDGDPDLYVTNFGKNRLFRNDGDRFNDITDTAGVGDEAWGASAAFADLDNDGDLDLVVTNYLSFTIAGHKECSLGRRIPSYCSPSAYPGAADRLYRNDGGGEFTDVTETSGIGDPNGKGLGVLCGDFDGDGATDIYIANDGVSNSLFLNRGELRFEDFTLFSGTGYNDDGVAQAGMGIAAGDLDGDGLTDIFVTNLSSETNVLYRGGADALFTDGTVTARLAAASLLYTGFGTVCGDFDHDGHLDLFVTNGHVIDNIREFYDYYTYPQPDQFYRNDGRGVFVEQRIGDAETAKVGRGAAIGDIDGDGDLDIVVTNCGGAPLIYRNEQVAGAWLGVRLHGTKSNRDGIGARVKIRAGGREQVREVFGGGSYLSQSALTVHFGLGSTEKVESLEVRWPSGRTSKFGPVETNRVITVREPEAP